MTKWVIDNILSKIDPFFVLIDSVFLLSCFVIIAAVISSFQPAPLDSTQNRWVDLGGNLKAKNVDAHTTCYLYGSGTLSCVYHP